ncbi:hypothetical protein AHAS_Ahas09G0254900 [Arachis hypogaea]
MHVITVEGMGSCKRVFISIAGLVLFSFLIGNMQTYLQSTTTTLEEMRVKRRDAEYQMSHRLLPDSLRQQIRQYEQYKWQETRGVDEDNLICNLPKDLRRDIKRHLCLALLMRVGGSSPSLGATIYASRFAANAFRLLCRNHTRKTRMPERIPPILLQKPAEPDFTDGEQ